MFVFSFTVVANTHAQQEKVNLDLKNVSIKMLFGKIQKQTALSFVFNTELTKDFGRISVKADNEAVESVLRRVLANTGLTYRYYRDSPTGVIHGSAGSEEGDHDRGESG